MSESIQKVLSRVRAPRVNITYDVEIGNAIVKKNLPFIIGVLSDLSGDTIHDDYKQKKFINIDMDNIADVIKSIAPTLQFTIDKTKVDLSFTSMACFTPDAILNKIPEFQEMIDHRIKLLDLVSKLDGNDELDTLLTQVKTDKSSADKLQTADFIKANLIEEDNTSEQSITRCQELIKSFAQLEAKDNIDNYNLINQYIAQLDQDLGLKLDAILHHPKFQNLESKWRGLKYLIDNCELGTTLKIKVFNATKAQIANDLDLAAQFDQSVLFKKIYEEEFGTFGGSPFSCLVADIDGFGKSAYDMSLLQKLTTIAAASHAPILSNVNPSMFGLKTFQTLSIPRDLAKIFESTELAAWNSFRETEDSRYAALVLPQMLIRSPYVPANVKAFAYYEQVNGIDDSNFCWANPAYALASKIAHAFSLYNWTASIRGTEGGGLVENLPAYTYTTSEGDIALKCPTQTPITDRREKELSDLGFIALCHHKESDKAVFFGGQTVQKPLAYNTTDATANSAISARLPYILNISRFAHYVKMIMRDKIGSSTTASDIQIYLSKWIAQYVLLTNGAPAALQAKYPLREAKVQIIDNPENPGSYQAILYLKPHFQMEELQVSLRLVANLPS